SGGLDHGLRHAMGTEHGDGAFGNFVQLFDEARALALQGIDHMLVVHDLVAHIDGLAIFIERLLHDIDGTHHASAEAAWLGKNDSHFSSFVPQAPALRRGPRWPDAMSGTTATQQSQFPASGGS